ncbi:MAG: sugar ABC transporter ATP-binding protein [Pirellulales bacterium]|nr:sugar ABC transporter ATP-binding protein [Pirellulales bacterium]
MTTWHEQPEPFFMFHNIRKAYAGNPVLRDVSWELFSGRILGLVGENGAGKSTLMNILGGVTPPDGGAMRLAGKPYAPSSPRDADQAGVAFIHQELNLFHNLSIAENLWLTRFPRAWWGIDFKTAQQTAASLLKQVGLEISPATLVERLSAGERQLVEIAKALARQARLIILDEPTTSLTAPEIERLFGLLRRLRANGAAIVYISHALADVRQLCQDLVIMRDGQVVAAGPVAEFDTPKIVSCMVGRTTDQLFPPRHSNPLGTELLRANRLTLPGSIRDISFSLKSGEILGVAGLMGSGRTELARILFGLDALRSGAVTLAGQDITHWSTPARISAGMAFLTENRRDDGLCLAASIAENLELVAAKRYSGRFTGMLHGAKLRAASQAMRQAVKLTPQAQSFQPVGTLSGGNQQKVVLGKWLLNQPRVFILDEPTRGIDVGAKYEIYCLIQQLAAAGSSVLLISSEIEELLGLCDRLLVLCQGEVVAEFDRSEFERERILSAALRADTPAHSSPAKSVVALQPGIQPGDTA